MANSLLEVRGLKKYFGATKVLDGIELDIFQGQVTTIVGKSGMGRSVLLKCLAGILQSDAGEIQHDGKLLNPVDRCAVVVCDSVTCFRIMLSLIH